MSALKLDITNLIAVLTLDMPGSRANTLGQAILAEFELALEQLKSKPELHGLILCSGKPGMFIAGADLKELGAAPHNPEQTRTLVKRGLDLIAGFESLPFPTVAAIDGACMGGGLELALGFDFRLAGGASQVRDRPAGNEDRADPRLGRHPAAFASHRPGLGRRADMPR